MEVGSNIANTQLRRFVERIEALEDEKAALQEDIKQLFKEVKGNGFDTKIVKMVIKERKLRRDNAEARAEQLELFDIYLEAVETPEKVEA